MCDFDFAGVLEVHTVGQTQPLKSYDLRTHSFVADPSPDGPALVIHKQTPSASGHAESESDQVIHNQPTSIHNQPWHAHEEVQEKTTRTSTVADQQRLEKLTTSDSIVQVPTASTLEPSCTSTPALQVPCSSSTRSWPSGYRSVSTTDQAIGRGSVSTNQGPRHGAVDRHGSVSTPQGPRYGLDDGFGSAGSTNQPMGCGSVRSTALDRDAGCARPGCESVRSTDEAVRGVQKDLVAPLQPDQGMGMAGIGAPQGVGVTTTPGHGVDQGTGGAATGAQQPTGAGTGTSGDGAGAAGNGRDSSALHTSGRLLNLATPDGGSSVDGAASVGGVSVNGAEGASGGGVGVNGTEGANGPGTESTAVSFWSQLSPSWYNKTWNWSWGSVTSSANTTPVHCNIFRADNTCETPRIPAKWWSPSTAWTSWFLLPSTLSSATLSTLRGSSVSSWTTSSTTVPGGPPQSPFGACRPPQPARPPQSSLGAWTMSFTTVSTWGPKSDETTQAPVEVRSPPPSPYIPLLPKQPPFPPTTFSWIQSLRSPRLSPGPVPSSRPWVQSLVFSYPRTLWVTNFLVSHCPRTIWVSHPNCGGCPQ